MILERTKWNTITVTSGKLSLSPCRPIISKLFPNNLVNIKEIKIY
jgi:hypothetical protein